MVSTLQVEMERSYLTAEVFREILQQNGRSNENGEVIRTLSGRQVSVALFPLEMMLHRLKTSTEAIWPFELSSLVIATAMNC